MLMSPLTKMISMAITGVCLLGIFAVGPAAAATNTAVVINIAAATRSVSATKAVAEVDTQLQPYSKVSGISGNLSSVGSDTLANLMTYWTEAFKRQYPNVNIQIQTSGSSTAPTALVEATAQLGPMSREMKTKEVEAFEKEYGYKPTAIKVAVDALAVFVHEDNPLKGINFEQLDAIYSRTLRCGAVVPITRWGQLGLPNSWQQRDIQLFGRNSVSGTYGDFKKRALCRGDFRNNVNEQPGSASVVQSVSTSLNAIGYSGIGYKTTGIRAIPVAREGTDYVEATVENSINGNYPLSRYLYLYINKHPNKALAPMEQEFLRFILSSDGQNIVQKDGYIPLPVAIVKENMVKLGLKVS